MIVEIKNYVCIVTREEGDPKFYGVANGAGESTLLHHVKKKLNDQGYSLIKKRMYKDGHLVDDMQQYLRTQKPSGDPDKDIYIYNNQWAINGAEEAFNKQGKVELCLVKNVFKK